VPSPDKELRERIGRFVAFYDFLKREYARVLDEKLLATAIRTFRSRFTSSHFTDEKVIDSLIWGFVDLSNKDALINNQIAYS
jgi:hypothetical protein